MRNNKILGAGLDVLEYENSSFESLFTDELQADTIKYLIKSDKVLLSPHIAGLTIESQKKLAHIIVDKIKTIIN